MKNVILISFFKSDNIGDLVLSEKLFEEFNKKSRVKKLDFVTGSFNINNESKFYTKNILENENFNKKSIKYLLKSNSLIKEVINLKNAFKCIKCIDWETIENHIKESDLIVIGGGNMLMGLAYDFPLLFNKYVKLAKKHNKNISVISVGVGPFRNNFSKYIVKKSLKGIEHITTRDKKSQKLLQHITRKNNIELSCDPAMLYENRTTNINKNKIAISIYPYQEPTLNVDGDNEKYKKYIYELAFLVEKVNKKLKKEIILFSTEINDYKAVEDVYSLLSDETKKNTIIKYVSSLEDIIGVYNITQLLIGTRLHSMIIAYTQIIPIIGLSWQPKVDGFFQYIDREKYNFKIDNIKKSSDNILKLCQECINNYEEEVNNIIINKEKIVNDFKINFKYL